MRSVEIGIDFEHFDTDPDTDFDSDKWSSYIKKSPMLRGSAVNRSTFHEIVGIAAFPN
jgi:hypothetical protein